MHYWDCARFRGRSVLDVGCGPGWLTVQYAAAGANVTAVDLTPRAVELCRRHLEYRGLSAAVQTGNAEELPFPDDAFDLVVASGCFITRRMWNGLSANAAASCARAAPGS